MKKTLVVYALLIFISSSVITYIGASAKLQHKTYANFMLNVGLFLYLFSVTLFLVYIFRRNSQKNK